MLALGEAGHNTRLAAPRRYGKTSLILALLAEARRAGLHAVHVDFYRALTVDEVARRLESAYLAQLSGPVRRSAASLLRTFRVRARAGAGVAAVEAETRSEDAAWRLERILDMPRRIFERTGARTIVAFDECQDFLRVGGGIDGLVRSRIQLHRDEAAYVFAGSEPGLLEALFSERERPLYGQARPIELPPLPDDELAEYVARRFERTGRDCGEALDALLDLVRGHPQRSMLMAHHLWEHTPRGGVADAETFAEALAVVEHDLRESFERFWQALADAPNQRRVLRALASGRRSLYAGATLAEFGLDKSGVQSGLRGLAAIGEIRREGGSVRIVDPLLERWAQERP